MERTDYSNWLKSITKFAQLAQGEATVTDGAGISWKIPYSYDPTMPIEQLIQLNGVDVGEPTLDQEPMSGPEVFAPQTGTPGYSTVGPGMEEPAMEPPDDDVYKAVVEDIMFRAENEGL